jgi:phosphoglycerate dehydrogenase-like enzyme
MLLYKATSTLDNYLPPQHWTDKEDQAEILLVGGRKFDLDDFPKLRGVFKTGVGTDNLPFAQAEERGVLIGLPSCGTREIIYEETANFACHLILNGLYTGIADWESWSKYDRRGLGGQKLLVIGAGNIGSRVAHKMRSFMDVQTFDTAVDDNALLQSRLEGVDCVSLHIPLNEGTRGMFDRERLSWLPDGALLVNTARGPVVDEAALYDELSQGRLRAALDVFWEEPYRGVLADLPSDRLLCTPHIASTCKEFLQETAQDFLSFLDKLSADAEGTA